MEGNKQFGDLIVEVHKKTKTVTEQRLKSLGLGMGQLHVLMLFYTKPGESFSQNELVNILQIDKGNISRNIHKLVEKNYLSTTQADQRRYALTDLGFEIKKQIMTTFIELQSIITKGISEEALETTISTLKKISNNYEELL